MSITFKWIDLNAAPSEFRIYRSTSRIADGALPAPLATVAGNVFQYVDKTALRNVLYYYRVGSMVDGIEVLSPNQPLMFLPDSGPGPQKLLRGNYEAGYFGSIPLEELVTGVDFATYYGLTWQVVTSNAPTKWLKFISKGKVLFFPDYNGLLQSVTPNQVYQAGLMYGTNDAAVISDVMRTPNGVVNQVRPYRKGDWTFIPRCPISRADRTLTTQTPAEDWRGGEIDLVFAPCFFNRSLAASQFANVRQIDDLLNSTLYFFTQDTYVTGVICRGTAAFDAQQGLNPASTSGTYNYRPVLELVF